MKIFEKNKEKEIMIMIIALVVLVGGFITMFYVENTLTGLSVYEENITNQDFDKVKPSNYDGDTDIEIIDFEEQTKKNEKS